MKKHLLCLAFCFPSFAFAQDEPLPLTDGSFTLNGVERPFKPFKDYIQQTVKLEIELRTYLATNPSKENALTKDILDRLHFAKINALQGHNEARIKQKSLMQSLLSMGVSSTGLTTLNELYNDGEESLISNFLENKCGQLVSEACFEAGMMAKDVYKAVKAGYYFEKAHNADVKSAKYLAYLGDVQLRIGSLEAEKTFVQGLALNDQAYNIQLKFGLASFYGLVKKIDEKELILRQILAGDSVIDKRISTKTFIQLAQISYEKGNLKEAESYADKVVALGLDHFPDAEIENIATGYNNLGAIYEDAGRKFDAEIIYKKAIKLGEHFYQGRKHINLARRYYNLGVLYVLDKRYDEGLAFQHKALAIANEKRVEGDLSKTGRWLTGIAMTYSHLKDAPNADSYFKNAALFFTLNKDKTSADYVAFVDYYSDFLRVQNRNNEANALRKNVGQKT